MLPNVLSGTYHTLGASQPLISLYIFSDAAQFLQKVALTSQNGSPKVLKILFNVFIQIKFIATVLKNSMSEKRSSGQTRVSRSRSCSPPPPPGCMSWFLPYSSSTQLIYITNSSLSTGQLNQLCSARTKSKTCMPWGLFGKPWVRCTSMDKAYRQQRHSFSLKVSWYSRQTRLIPHQPSAASLKRMPSKY